MFCYLQKMTLVTLNHVRMEESVKFYRWTHITASALMDGMEPTVNKVGKIALLCCCYNLQMQDFL